MTWTALVELMAHRWGDFASLLGLIVSAVTLSVATKAREAAEATRVAARRQNLMEVLQDAARKSEQVGIFLSQQKWDIVGLRAQEIIAATSLVLTRWSEQLSLGSRSNLLRCQGLSSSISDVALVASSRSPTVQQVARMAQAYGRVTQLLNAELGEALRSAEGSG
jgi:hypothetical protein